MLCACYGDTGGDDGAYETRVKSEWVRVKVWSSFGFERRRWFILRTSNQSASLAHYADDQGRRLLGTLPVPSLDIIGDAELCLKLCRRDAHPREVAWTLRFETLLQKLQWWQALRLARNRPRPGVAVEESIVGEEESVVDEAEDEDFDDFDERRGETTPRRRKKSTGKIKSPSNTDEAADVRANRSDSNTPMLADTEDARPGDDDGDDDAAGLLAGGLPATQRRGSETLPAERGVVWESHGMCVVEDADGRIAVEPRLLYTVKVAYSRLLRAFIRPPRAEYDLTALGPRTFSFRGRAYVRKDKQVRNARGRCVQYSVWREVETEKKKKKKQKKHEKKENLKEPKSASVDQRPDEAQIASLGFDEATETAHYYERRSSLVTHDDAGRVIDEQHRSEVSSVRTVSKASRVENVSSQQQEAAAAVAAAVPPTDLSDRNSIRASAATTRGSQRRVTSTSSYASSSASQRQSPRRNEQQPPSSSKKEPLCFDDEKAPPPPKSSSRRASSSSEKSGGKEGSLRATVMYLHGNASSRVEGLAQLALSLALGPGVQFIALDCCGSGHSEGEFVSLGLKEQEDVVAVLEAEAALRGLGKVVLWGRSMGAVTALLVASTRFPETAALVLDSAYSSLRDLSLDVARRGAANLPAFVTKSALRWIRDSVARRADFDIFEVDAARQAPECVVPAFFICGADDTFVEPKHTSTLHDLLASPHKELCICPGTHNSTRPKDAFDRCQAFLRDHLDLGSSQEVLFASSLDADLAPLLPESRRADRPNFAALAPWTIENLVGARRRADDYEDIARNVTAPPVVDSPPTPRWLDDVDEEQHRVDKVEEMQASTFAAAKALS